MKNVINGSFSKWCNRRVTEVFWQEAHADSSMQCYPHKLPCSLSGQLRIMHMDRAFKYLNLNGSDKEGTLVPSSVSIIWKTTNHIPSFLLSNRTSAMCPLHFYKLSCQFAKELGFVSGYTDGSTRQRVLPCTHTTGMTHFEQVHFKTLLLEVGVREPNNEATLGFHQCYWTQIQSSRPDTFW